ncbi:hypothetical protein [Nonomuraea typhae]|uniref:hypothetical protein n=1 Tax=Nonomuraea typhae TaxID=2603600 RepID=UPI0012FC11CE|nr:hypothetical protein [Nonomuraea typhae]
MTAVVVSLVAVVLLVLVVVALGMRSMNRRESSLPPERLKDLVDREEMKQARSTDEFAAHEPRMTNFSPDFSPIDEVKQPRPVRTGQRGKRGVDEWGNPSSDDEDEEFWANIRSDAEEGGFGAGGTVAARKGASRPVGADRPMGAERPLGAERPVGAERPAGAERPVGAQRPAGAERPMGAPRPVEQEAPVSAADPNATTVQQALPQRAPAAKANLADLVESTQRMDAVPAEAPAPPSRSSRRAKSAPTPAPTPAPAPSAADVAEQRTMAFAAPTPDVMSILGPGAQQVAPPTPPSSPTTTATPAPAATSGAYPATPSGQLPPSPSFTPSNSRAQSQAHAHPAGTNSGAFPAVPNGAIHGAPTSDPFPAYVNNAETWQSPVSGSWPATPVRDVLDDPAPGTSSGSWPAFEAAYTPRGNDYPASYEVRAGWAVADDSEVTGPTPATGTPTTPSRAVSAFEAYDDVLSAPAPAVPAAPPQPAPYPAYETGDYAPSTGGAAWPEPPAGNGSWPGYSEVYGTEQQQPARQGGRRRAPEQQDYPDYYR